MLLVDRFSGKLCHISKQVSLKRNIHLRCEMLLELFHSDGASDP